MKAVETASWFAIALLAVLFTICIGITNGFSQELNLKTSELWEQDEELDGYIQPQECRRDLTWVETPVFRIPGPDLVRIYRRAGYNVNSATGAQFNQREADILGIKPGIYVNEDMAERLQEIVVHHERCHVVVPSWTHSDWKPKHR